MPRGINKRNETTPAFPRSGKGGGVMLTPSKTIVKKAFFSCVQNPPLWCVCVFDSDVLGIVGAFFFFPLGALGCAVVQRCTSCSNAPHGALKGDVQFCLSRGRYQGQSSASVRILTFDKLEDVSWYI